MTLVTVPLPLRTQTPRCLVLANRATLSAMSAPLDISMTWLRRALGLSLVTKMGGLGLFLEPGGRPLGRLVATSIAPSLGSSLLLSRSSSSSPPDPPRLLVPVVLLFIEIPRSGLMMFFIGELVAAAEVSFTPPGRPTCPAHHRFAMVDPEK